MTAAYRILLVIAAASIIVTLLWQRCDIENGINWGDAPTWLGAIGSLLVIMVAIWGDEIHDRLVGPRLRLRLNDHEGEPIPLGGVGGRYFHVQAINDRPSSPALHARVMLIRAEELKADGGVEPFPMAGPLWLLWRYGTEIPNRDEITLRRYDFADLFYIRAADIANGMPFPHLIIALKVQPSNFPAVIAQRPIRMRLYVQLLADNGESEILGVEIDWDGECPGDTTPHLSKHLKIRILDREASRPGIDIWRYQR